MMSTSSMPEGYATLAAIEASAPRYNAWLGRQLRTYLGRRVLEVGAGIGTITREILPGREMLIALEGEATYAAKLEEAFRTESRVRTVHRRVEDTDWSRFVEDRLDSIVLSNVLEHIVDDGAAMRNFRTALTAGANIVILVPALPALFGTLDEAVGHQRRYMPSSLRTVIEANGFRVDHLNWMNLAAIPGWFINGRIFRRRVVSPRQLRLYDRFAPVLARIEAVFRLPVGMSLLAVARAV